MSAVRQRGDALSDARRVGELLSDARRVGELSCSIRTAAAATRQWSQAVRTEARRAVAQAERVAGACPYARIVGSRGRARMQTIVRRDGTTTDDGQRLDVDPLKVTLAVARRYDHVTSISIHTAGRRPGVPQVLATGQFDPESDATDTPVEAARRQIADSLNQTVIRQLFAVGLTATSLQQRTDDPALQTGLRNMVVWLDDVIRQVRSAVFDLGAVREDRTPVQTEGLDRIVARLAILGGTAVSLQKQTADPFVRTQLVRFVAALDQSLAELRYLAGSEDPEPPGGYDEPPAAA